MKKSILLLAGLFLFGCSTFAQNYKAELAKMDAKKAERAKIPEAQNTFQLSATYDKAWKAAVASISEKSLPIKTIDKESGVISTEIVIFADGYDVKKNIDAFAKRPPVTYDFAEQWTKGKYSFHLFMEQTGDALTVRIVPLIEGMEDNKWYQCYSKGVLEKEIFDSIAAKVK